MKPDKPLLFVLLVGFAWHAGAADNPRCLAEYKAEEARIIRDAERVGAANPPGRDVKAQQQSMLPVHDALKAAAERAERCNRSSRPTPSPDTNMRLTQCAEKASQQIEGLHRNYANRTNLSRNEQMALRNEENRITEERMNCMQKAR